jgi:hypothetical protein
VNDFLEAKLGAFSTKNYPKSRAKFAIKNICTKKDKDWREMMDKENDGNHLQGFVG